MCVFFFSLCAGDSVRVLICDFSTFGPFEPGDFVRLLE